MTEQSYRRQFYEMFSAFETTLGVFLLLFTFTLSPYCKTIPHMCVYTPTADKDTQEQENTSLKVNAIAHACASILLLTDLSLTSLPQAPPFFPVSKEEKATAATFLKAQEEQAIKAHAPFRE